MSTPQSQSQPVLVTFSVLAGLQILTGGALLAEVVGVQVAGLLALVVAAVQFGMTYYVQGLVVPNNAVAVRQLPSGDLVAGPAAPSAVASEGEAVEVVAPPIE